MKRSTIELVARRAAGTLSLLGAVAINGCSNDPARARVLPSEPGAHFDHNSAAHDDKGYIDGWFNGEAVSLRYTKVHFCARLLGAVGADCVLGALPEEFPRPGNIPKIYAIAPVGFAVDPATLSCPPNSVCLNHPAMIDASRLGNPLAINVPPVPHSHIIGERGSGWHQTVNVRVFNVTAWNEIVAAKSLDKIRELQGDPGVGVPGVISADTPTNIFFFVQVHQDQ